MLVNDYFPCFLRFDIKAGVDPEETRSPQRVLFDLAIANANPDWAASFPSLKERAQYWVDQMLDVLFEAIASDLSEDAKLVWLFRLAKREWEEKEKFRSLLHAVSLDLVGSLSTPNFVYFCV